MKNNTQRKVTLTVTDDNGKITYNFEGKLENELTNNEIQKITRKLFLPKEFQKRKWRKLK